MKMKLTVSKWRSLKWIMVTLLLGTMATGGWIQLSLNGSRDDNDIADEYESTKLFSKMRERYHLDIRVTVDSQFFKDWQPLPISPSAVPITNRELRRFPEIL